MKPVQTNSLMLSLMLWIKAKRKVTSSINTIEDTKIESNLDDEQDLKIKKFPPEIQRKIKSIREGFLEALRNAGDDQY